MATSTVPKRCKLCWGCGKKSIEALKCSRCMFALYCDHKCQKLHWSAHKLFCGQLHSQDITRMDRTTAKKMLDDETCQNFSQGVAFRIGDIRKVKSLIAEGLDLNLIDEKVPLSPLMIASYSGHAAVCKILLESGALVNLCDRKGCAAFKMACEGGHAEIMSLLLDGGADPKKALIAEARDGSSFLMDASKCGGEDVVKVLLSVGANVNHVSRDGFTALSDSCQEGHVVIAKLLIAAGAKLDLRGKNMGGPTPLMLASDRGHIAVVNLMIAAGAYVNYADVKCINNTSLLFACHNGHVDVVAALVKAGASVNQTNDNNESPLMTAIDTCSTMASAATGHAVIIFILASAGADLAASAGEYSCDTPLILACKSGKVAAVHALLSAGADLNQVCECHGHDALKIASMSGQASVVRYLCAAGANIDNVDRTCYYTALMGACQEGHQSVVTALLNEGADINKTTRRSGPERMNALIAAALNGRKAIVKKLLAAGAIVNDLGPTGIYSKALESALGMRHHAVANILVAAGAIRRRI